MKDCAGFDPRDYTMTCKMHCIHEINSNGQNDRTQDFDPVRLCRGGRPRIWWQDRCGTITLMRTSYLFCCLSCRLRAFSTLLHVSI